mmetsp:Transcript_11094/g.36504  ORF Transcript_11094/g.36504 Transcript_11094/m.36504 type:complete len:943 (+) Transcript_11094:157-2985(+)|eukprot:CAMPEP_0170144854 /NCGR_PEP_ID=MMETSP0033_2-20121228/16207_1 /TAXON_ID=195969 /ORGANISM="Dolichomastix tenuilepis, Strain CCMP3274" /LENGTH=942 /DNA_ID=CAMNT_0010381379 /DNA_START=150 /DNA_END=2978 /DNA_ORIENTATION=-
MGGCCASLPVPEDTTRSATDLAKEAEAKATEEFEWRQQRVKELGFVPRRLAFATPIEDEAIEERASKPLHKKQEHAPEVRQWLLSALQENSFFKKQGETVLQQLVDVFERVDVEKEETLFTQGDEGDHLFFVHTGTLKATIRRTTDRRLSYTVNFRRSIVGNTEMVTFKAGQCLGELSVIFNKPRAATMRALEPCVLYRLSRQDFRAILRGAYEELVFLMQLPMLLLTEHSLMLIAERVTTAVFQPGDKIVCEGDAMEHFTIIRRGAIDQRKRSGGERSSIGVLRERNFFGGTELIAGETAFYDYVAAGDAETEVVRLDAAAFRQMLPSLRAGLTDYLIYVSLKKLPICSTLTENDLGLVVDAFKPETYRQGEEVVKAGEIGEALFVVQTGRLEARGERGEALLSYRAGTVFGERALVTRERRAAAVVVTSAEATLLRLERKAFEVLLGPLADRLEEETRVKIIQSVPLLHSLSKGEAVALAKAMQYATYQPGDVVISEGEVGDTFFLVKDGEVEALKAGAVVGTINGGGFFGEKALLANETRQATIRAKTATEVFYINRESFERHLSKLEYLINLEQERKEREASSKVIPWQELDLINILGEGAFGSVHLAKRSTGGPKNNNDDTPELYAVKNISKNDMAQARMVGWLLREVQVLQALDSPFIIKFHRVFNRHDTLSLLLELVPGGELNDHAATLVRPNEHQFVAACALKALEYMHANGVMYRDLKQENLMVDRNGFIKVVDLGLAKFFDSSEYRTFTSCGTLEYMAPEVLVPKIGYTCKVDLWAWAVLLYELIAYESPFATAVDDVDEAVYDAAVTKAILSVTYKRNPRANMPPHAVELIASLLKLDESQRLGAGAGGAAQIACHPYFRDFDFAKLEARDPSIVPDAFRPVVPYEKKLLQKATKKKKPAPAQSRQKRTAAMTRAIGILDDVFGPPAPETE